jgi:stress-induced morphogen
LPYCHVQKFWHKLRLQGADSRRSPPMAMDASEIERLIKAGIPDAKVTIRDLAGDRDHYAATVISAAFKGKTRVQQHQLVYNALKGQMGDVLHALALQTAAPDA